MNNIPIAGSKKAFTLVELMVVVIIVGILATVGIPKYMKTFDAAQIRDIQAQLTALHAANEIYRAQDGDEYWPGPGANVAAINNGLKINIIAAGNVIYTYTRSDKDNFNARGTFTSGQATYTIQVDQNPISSSNPSCTASPGSCPS